MDMNIDAEQIERVLSCLAQLRHDRDRNPNEVNVLDRVKPAWVRMDTWDAVLDDLEAQRYRELERAHPRTRPRLQLVRG